MSYAKCLRCVNCQRTYPIEAGRYICESCGEEIISNISLLRGLLQVEYDFSSLKLTRKDIENRGEKSIWKYRDLLPLDENDEIVSLGEGGTPLIRCPRFAAHLGLKSIYIKNEGMSPIGSFKDRETSVIISMAKKFGFKKSTIASSGNAGGAVAAFSNHAGILPIIFVPIAFSPSAKMATYAIMGMPLIGINGYYEDTNEVSLEVGKKLGFYLCNHGFNPYRIEGDKTTAYEICEQMDWEVPDKVIVPSGSGGDLSGQWKGYSEFLNFGLINRRPQMIAAMVEAGAPLLKALEQNKDTIEPDLNARHSIADGVVSKYHDYAPLLLRAIRDSGGTAVAVSEDEIRNAQKLLARLEGVFVEPSSAVGVATLIKMAGDGGIKPDERVVCINTATGLKNPEVVLKDFQKPPVIEPGPKALDEVLKLLEKRKITSE